MHSTLILIAGYAAAGKNHVGKRLARDLSGTCYVDKDTLAAPIIDRLLVALGQREGDRDSPTYQNQVRPLEYQALLDVCFEAAPLGANVIASAPFLAQLVDRDWMTKLKDNVATRGLRLRIVWVHCDLDSLRDRMVRRGSPRDVAKLNDWENYRTTIDLEFPDSVDAEVFVFDNSNRPQVGFDEQFRSLLDFILH
jgi:predicted kinase